VDGREGRVTLGLHMQKLTVVKLGGRLITDARRSRTVRVAELQRLALEVGGAAVRLRGGLLVAHGSGSFGHPAAEKTRLVPGRIRRHRLAGVSTTQLEARQLHARVLESLDEAGLCPYSLPPSAFLTAAKGRPVHVAVEPLYRALKLGLVPVLYEDIAMDRDWGAGVVPVETSLPAVLSRLRRRRVPVRRVVWAVVGDGVQDRSGKTIRRLTPRTAPEILRDLEENVEASAQNDHLKCALLLARRGITSWIVNGEEPGVVAASLVERSPHGTKVAPPR
jgi:isopentenyl phosphate kinase